MTIKNKIVDHQLFKQAKIALLFLSFMCVGAYAEAQNFQSTSSYLNSSSPQTVEQTAAASPQQAYKSTIYEPFSSATPSSDANGSNNGNARGMSGRRNAGDFGHPDDPNKDPESPVGEPWIMLAFAAMGAGVIYLKQRKRSEIKD
jgi:hypothetical protein